jgi:eukaryotic-like serine/threonine-protein kinase
VSDVTSSLEDLAVRVADGKPVDWGAAMRGAATDEERSVVEQLRLMASVARAHADGGDEAAASAPATPPAAIGAWGPLALRERLGAGSFGELWRAWDPRLEREVALKLLEPRPGAAAATVIEEARLLAKLRHPNVVVIHGADVHDGRVGLWMELIAGRSLEQLLRDQGAMSAGEAAAIGVELCRALAAVHGTGIVHRDVKAQNVMREAGGRIVLMDFGAGVDRERAPADSGGKITGTPFYMAPELLRGAPASARSDLYALGVLLFRLVTGTFPIEARSWLELADRLARDDRSLLRDVRPGLPESFVAAIERATAADPEQRFATAGQMEHALAQTAGAAAPAPAAAAGRRRGAIGIALVTAALAGVGVAFLARDLAAPKPPPPAASGAPAAAAPVPVAPSPAPTYTVSASVHRVAAGSGVRELLAPGARVAVGDRITLELETSAPLWVYVVNEDEAGHAYALFPLPDLEPRNPLGPGRHVLPGTRDGTPLSWTVDTPGGREHLLVLASPERLAEYEAEMRALARPGEVAVALPEAARLRLRGIGGLGTSPESAPSRSAGTLFEMAQRLAANSEVVSGVWLRRIELANPAP